MSSRPVSSTAIRTAARTRSSSRTSVAIAWARPPLAVMAATVSSSVPGVDDGSAAVERATHTTSIPRAANVLASAAPIPLLAPVTSATCPSNIRLI